MPTEIEAKIKVNRLDMFISRLRQSGGQFEQKVFQRDTFFDRPDGSLLRRDCGLRLRAESESTNSRSWLCFKGARREGTYKQREEIEFAVGDLAGARRLLEALGFVATIVVEKQRQVYRLADCLVCLDAVSELGEFVEIEGPSEAAVRDVQTRLGLADAELIRDSYAVLQAGQAENPG